MDSVRVRLLGELTVEGCDAATLGRRQARTVLKVLALHHGHAVSTDQLSDCLWGDEPPAKAADQVSVLVSRLRALVGTERIHRSDAGYTLQLDWLDVDALSQYCDEAERRLGASAVGAARAAASAGLALVRGPLLADEADPWWAEAERARVQRLVARLHHVAGTAALAAGDGTEAAQQAEAALSSDPFDEAALRLQMEALARAGRPGSALAAYAAFRSHLGDELGVPPSPETEELHDALVLGTYQPVATTRLDPTDGIGDLPGRGQVLAELGALVDRALAREGQFRIVEGEAGIGKTALLNAFRRLASERGATVVAVAGDELGQALPLQPMLDAIFELIRLRRRQATEAGFPPDGPRAGPLSREPAFLADGDAALAGVDADASLSGPDAGVLGPDAAILGPLLGLQSQALAATQLAALTDAAAGRALLFAAVNSVLRRQAERAPLVIIVDDLHLAGPATSAWLGQAVRRLADCSLAVVAGRREEEAATIPGVGVIRLGPLDVSAAAQVVGGERAAELHARSGGNPLFLVELAAAPVGEELPATIRQAVEDRCARAGPAGATIRTAAVLGVTVDLDLLAAVTGRPSAELLDHLEEGVRRRLLVEESSFEFRHRLVRQALAATVGATRSAYLHREAGRALRDRPDPDPLLVAYHARLGGDLRLASDMLTMAARRAVTRFSQDAAATLLDDAIQLCPTADAHVERARVRSMQMRYHDARMDIAAAVALGAGAEALEAGAWAAHFERRFDEALALADQGARQADTAELRASCLGLGGWVSLTSGDLVGARTRLVQAFEQEPGNLLAQAWMGLLCVNEGHPGDAVAFVHPDPGRGLAAYRFPNAYALMAAIMSLAMVGRPDEALAALATLDEEVTRMGASRWAPRVLNLRGWILRNLGAGAEADDQNEAALAIAGRLDMAEPLANGLLDLASGRLLAGDLDAAGARLRQAEPYSQLEHAFRWRHQLRFRLLTARLALARGDAASALAEADALAGDATAMHAGRYEVQARLVAAAARAIEEGGASGGAAASAVRVHRAHDGDRTDGTLAVTERLLERASQVAGVESWWITADVARAFGVPAWTEMARRRVGALLPCSGRYREALAAAATRYGLGY